MIKITSLDQVMARHSLDLIIQEDMTGHHNREMEMTGHHDREMDHQDNHLTLRDQVKDRSVQVDLIYRLARVIPKRDSRETHSEKSKSKHKHVFWENIYKC